KDPPEEALQPSKSVLMQTRALLPRLGTAANASALDVGSNEKKKGAMDPLKVEVLPPDVRWISKVKAETLETRPSESTSPVKLPERTAWSDPFEYPLCEKSYMRRVKADARPPSAETRRRAPRPTAERPRTRQRRQRSVHECRWSRVTTVRPVATR